MLKAQSDEVFLTEVGKPGMPPLPLAGHGGTMTAMAFDPADGRLLVTAGMSALTVWSTDDGSMKARVPLREGMRVAGVVVNRDGTLVGALTRPVPPT